MLYSLTCQKTSEDTMSNQITIKVEAVAPAGYTLKIEQAVGQCGGNEPRRVLQVQTCLSGENDPNKSGREI